MVEEELIPEWIGMDRWEEKSEEEGKHASVENAGRLVRSKQ